MKWFRELPKIGKFFIQLTIAIFCVGIMMPAIIGKWEQTLMLCLLIGMVILWLISLFIVIKNRQYDSKSKNLSAGRVNQSRKL